MNWVANYGIPSALLTKNGPKFVSRFCMAVFSTLGVHNITTSEYYPQIKGYAKRSNSTLISWPRHYVSKHQSDWNTYQFRVRYAYSIPFHRCVKVSPFSLVLTPTSSGPAIVVSTRTNLSTENERSSQMYARFKLIKRATKLSEQMDKNLKLLERCYKKDYVRRIHFASIF